jgi:hypothetical protein
MMPPPSRLALEMAEEHCLMLAGIVPANYVLSLSLRRDSDGVYRGEAIATRREAAAAPRAADSTIGQQKGNELPDKSASGEEDI